VVLPVGGAGGVLGTGRVLAPEVAVVTGAGVLTPEVAVVTGAAELAPEVAVVAPADGLLIGWSEVEQAASSSSTTARRAAHNVRRPTGSTTDASF